MKTACLPSLLLAFFHLIAIDGFSQAGSPSVESLKAAYDDKVKLDVLRPHDLAVADLNTKFAAALDRAQDTAQKAGNLEEAVAIKKEKEAVLAGGYAPSANEDLKTPGSLKTLRSTYRNAVSKLELERDKRWQPLKETLARALNGVVEALTKNGKLDEAVAAKKLREEVLAGASRPKSIGGATSATLSGSGKEFTNTLGMKFVAVPGTNVLMCVHETRRQDYAAYAAEVPTIDMSWKSQEYEGVPCGHEDAHPVVGVSWDDAQGFCAWLSTKEGKTYRLPTDREWSCAVGLAADEARKKEVEPEMLSMKIPDHYPYSGVFPPSSSNKAGNYADEAWKEKFPSSTFIAGYNDGYATTAPVMSFKPNKLGFFDLGGNAFEWVADWFNSSQTERVLRGAGFTNRVSNAMLSSFRDHRVPTSRAQSNGFRCVLETGSQP